MHFVPHFGHAKVYAISIWTPCFQIPAKTLIHVLSLIMFWWQIFLPFIMEVIIVRTEFRVFTFYSKIWPQIEIGNFSQMTEIIPGRNVYNIPCLLWLKVYIPVLSHELYKSFLSILNFYFSHYIGYFGKCAMTKLVFNLFNRCQQCRQNPKFSASIRAPAIRHVNTNGGHFQESLKLLKVQIVGVL